MRFKKKLRDAMGWLKSRNRERSGILLYHRVDRDPEDRFNLCVSPEHFDEQMSALARSRRVISLPKFVEENESGALQSGSVAITFDDGYVDVLTQALPILEKHHLPATLYVVTGNLGSPFWWDELSHAIHAPATLPDNLSLDDPEGRRHLLSEKEHSRATIYDRAYQILRSCSPSDREQAFDSLKSQIGDETFDQSKRAINSAELKKLADHPLITIGAHTESHSRLSGLSYEEQLREIETSKAQITTVIDEPVNTFSYPFGLRKRDYSDDTLRAVRAAGFEHALAADRGVVSKHTNRFALPRLWVHDRKGTDFRRALDFWL